MSSKIPAICQNQDCHTVWLTSSFLNIAPGKFVTIRSSAVSPCPKCKGIGRIPDGEYTNGLGILFSADDLARVRDALSEVNNQINRGATQSEVEATIESHPVLNHLKGLIPKDFKELAILIGLITAYVHDFSPPEAELEQDVHLKKDVSQVLHAIAHGLRDNQRDIRTTLTEQPAAEDSDDVPNP